MKNGWGSKQWCKQEREKREKRNAMRKWMGIKHRRRVQWINPVMASVGEPTNWRKPPWSTRMVSKNRQDLSLVWGRGEQRKKFREKLQILNMAKNSKWKYHNICDAKQDKTWDIVGFILLLQQGRKIRKKRFTIFVPIKQYCFDKALLSLFSLFLPFLFQHTALIRD